MTVRGENAVRRRIRSCEAAGLEVELSWHGVTDVGLRREVNQDSYVATPPIFAVADGMGGHAAGEIASEAVVRRLAELEGRTTVSHSDFEAALDDAIEDIELNVGETELGTGTTVTGLILGSDIEQPSWTVFNIGDSRVYQLFKGALSVRARDINNEMKLAAAYAIADLITDADRSEENIIPGAFDPRVAEAVANAVAKAARETGVARL